MLCKEHNIKQVCSRPYHPQTQDLVECSNQTFKERLCAIQATTGCPGWVDNLPEIQLIINTSPCSALPTHTTLHEVFFSCKPHWIRAKRLEDYDSDSDKDSINGDNNKEPYLPTDTEDIDLTTIETAIA